MTERILAAAECMPYVLKRIPEFETAWRHHREYWGDQEAGLCNDVSALTHFVSDLLAQNSLSLMPEIFACAEWLLAHGDEKVHDAVATCFLESLQNLASHGKFSTTLFVPFLGPLSRASCKGWDDFTGVKTDGLYDTEKPT